MSTALYVANIALHTIVSILVKSNDLLFFSNQWIFSASVPENKSLAACMPSPVFTSIAYGVAEPIYFYILRSGPPSWIWVLVLSAMVHPYASLLLRGSLRVLILEALPKGMKSPSKHPRSSASVEADEATEQDPYPVISIQRYQLKFLLLLPVQTAAATNAALLLQFHALDSVSSAIAHNDDVRIHWTSLGLETFAVFVYATTHAFFDGFVIPKQTWKHRYLRVDRPKAPYFRHQLLCLMFAIMTRTATRAAFGQHTLGAFWPPGPALETETFQGSVAAPVLATVLPKWAWSAVSVVMGPLTVTATCVLFARAEKEAMRSSLYNAAAT